MLKHVALATPLILAGFQCVRAGAQEEAATTPVDKVMTIAEAVQPSLVRVEISLRFDKGEAPDHIPNATDASTLIEQERPAELGGFVLSPTRVIVSDHMLHSRYIKRLQVRHGAQVVDAMPVMFARTQNAMVLELAEPLNDAKPLSFDENAEGPYFTVSYVEDEGEWATYVGPLWSSIALTDDGDRLLRVQAPSLIVDSVGTPVGMAFRDEVPGDSEWKGSPLNWPTISALDLADAVARIEDRTGRAVARVAVSFRSPNKDSADAMMYGSDGDETEWNGTGIVIDPHTVLVLANLKPTNTARLERVRVYQSPSEEPVDATFQATLKDYGAFVATTEEPLSGAAIFVAGDIVDLRDELLIESQVRVQGDTRTDFYQRRRLSGFAVGWRRQVYPQVQVWDEHPRFLFTTSGELVAFPVARRRKVTVEERWAYDDVPLTPVAYIESVLENLDANSDPNNVPLTEEEENRTAWLGVELQPMDEDLARINNVASETQDGYYGAMVTFVYPESPAARAGLQMGDILLRLRVEDQPRPLEVDLSEDRFTFGILEQFPWDQLDQVPEQFFDQIPQPWPPVNTEFMKKVTQLGFGTNFTLEYVRNGEKHDAEMRVEESPPYYTSASKYECEPVGLTVKELTFEVRRYFQRKQDDPGVVISKIDPGSKASIAGLKPYEVITHINDEPVLTVDDFERLSGPGGELRFNVKRMARGRIVKIEVPAASSAVEVEDGTEDGN